MRRSDIPEPLTDVRLWPSVDPGALEPPRRAIYQQREQAIHAYLLGVPLADIARNNKIDASFLTRLLARCRFAHRRPDPGLPRTYSACPRKAYRRSRQADRRGSRGGLTGAMGQLFERLPQLTRIIERQIGGGSLGLTQTDRLYGLAQTHSKLIAACHEAGLAETAYPLNDDEKGYRSLARWVKRRLHDRIPLRLPRDNGAWKLRPGRFPWSS